VDARAVDGGGGAAVRVVADDRGGGAGAAREPGLYRLVHTQRIVWCERDGANMRLRKSHASSPQNLKGIERMFDRTRGRYPAEEVRRARRAARRKSE